MTAITRLEKLVVACVMVLALLAGEAIPAPPVPGVTKNRPADPYAVGCILPLTGRHASSGAKTLDAIVLALGLFNPAKKSPFKLIIEDSESRQEAVREAVARLANDHNVLFILGPLAGAEAVEAAKEAQKQRIPIITLTQKEGITETGIYVFRHYLTARTQIEALVEYAMHDLGLKRFAILHPDDPYGREMAGLFRLEVQKQRGQIHKIRSYEKSKTDFGKEIKDISGISSTAQRKKATGGSEMEEEEYKPVIRFDALFIPDTASRLHMIAPQLAFYNVRDIRLLGTNLWNQADTGKSGSGDTEPSPAAALLEGAVFIDGFSSAGTTLGTADFTESFYGAYGREPGTLEAMAYDIIRITAGIIVDEKVTTREAFRDKLLKVKDYAGATGKTSFAGSRDARKDILRLTIEGGRVVQIK